MSAAALLSMATSGATFIINMSREAKNPKKAIPFCIVVANCDRYDTFTSV